jgi:hypothetical protein
MHETVASEIWGELKRYVNTVDRAEAAETVVSILIDNDCDVDDIKSAFSGDKDIKLALSNYLDQGEDESEYEEDEDDDESDFDRDWEN